MATVVFYEKPGCINNGKQKEMLRQAGHTVVEKDLLVHCWSVEELRSFFGNLPSVSQWFNPAAPRVKSGEVCPALIDAERALRMMLADPYLIRRPLMESGGIRVCGFDPAAVHAWVGLAAPGEEFSAESYSSGCPNPSPSVTPCP